MSLFFNIRSNYKASYAVKWYKSQTLFSNGKKLANYF